MRDGNRSLRAGLIGAGIQGSRSPAIQMTEARALGLDLAYHLFDLDRIPGGEEMLPSLLARLRSMGYCGVNITYPIKQSVIKLLDSCSDDVKSLGACNTVVFQDNRSIGHNTDWKGFSDSFVRGLPGASLDTVLQLGAGGAGSAVSYALLRLGAKRILVHDIDRGRADAFVDRFNKLAGAERLFSGGMLEHRASEARGVVNCTPMGMTRLPGSPLPAAFLRPELWVADIVYFPLRTELLRLAAAKGCRTLAGGGMVVFQAAEALRLFSGKMPDTQRMLAQFEHDTQVERMAN